MWSGSGQDPWICALRKHNHVIGTQKTATTMVPDCSTAFHVYGLQWNADSNISVDGNIYFKFSNEHSGKDALAL